MTARHRDNEGQHGFGRHRHHRYVDVPAAATDLHITFTPPTGNGEFQTFDKPY